MADNESIELVDCSKANAVQNQWEPISKGGPSHVGAVCRGSLLPDNQPAGRCEDERLDIKAYKHSPFVRKPVKRRRHAKKRSYMSYCYCDCFRTIVVVLLNLLHSIVGQRADDRQQRQPFYSACMPPGSKQRCEKRRDEKNQGADQNASNEGDLLSSR